MSKIDPNELEALIKRMRDAGRSEERIAEVTKLYKEQYAKKAKGSTVTAANVEPVQDAVNLENGAFQLENISSEYKNKNSEINIPYPTQPKDVIASFKTSDDYLKNLKSLKTFYNSKEGKEYAQQKVNYRASVRTKLNNNGAYKLGLEGQSISELQEKGLFSALAGSANELHFGMYGDSMPDTRTRDLIIKEEIEKAKAQESKKLLDLELDEAAKYQKAGNYDATIDKGYNSVKSELTPDQIEYKELMDKASDIRANIIKTEDISIIKNYQTELLDLEEKIKKVEPLALEDKSPLLDALTGQPLGTFEATELPPEQVIDTKSEIKKLKDSYKSITQENLERKFFTHTLDTQRLNKSLQRTIKNAKGVGVPGFYGDVKIEDLLPYRNNSVLISSIQKSIDEQKTDEQAVTFDLKGELDALAEEKINLTLQKEALKETYVLNVSPSSETPGFVSKVGSFGKEAAKSIGRIVGVDEEIANMLPSTRMEELDEINKLFNSDAIAVSEENKAAFNRDFTMNLAEGLGAFTGDLIQFALLNKVAGAAGLTARIAQISSKNKVLGTSLKLLQEEFNFQVVTRGEAPTGEGIFFGLGSMGAAKLVPKIKNSSFSALNNLMTKTVSGGLGMAGGSEAAAFSHAVVDDLLGKKDIETSLEEQYGSLDETGKRIVLNIAMGAALGVKSINKRDFYSIARRKKLLKETITDLDNNKFKGSEKTKKLQLVAELNADIALAEEKFNKLSIKEQAESKEVAAEIIKTGEIEEQPFFNAPSVKRKANAFELKEAQKIVDSYEINRLLAEKSIRKSFENLMRSGIVKNAKLVITDDPSILEAGNKGEFLTDGTNTIKININEYKPGVFEQEVGHLFMKAAFNNNPKIAEAFKTKIQKEVTEALKDEKFNVGDKQNISFEEAINEAYKDRKNDIPEEYIMNLVEFLSTPKFKDLLLKKGLLNSLKQETLNIGNKIGIDYTNKKNFKTGADLLEFLFSIGKTIEGGSSKAIKNKFEAFKNLVIDGNKLLDLKTGKKAADPKEAEKTMASAKIEESEKKDIFSKANNVYEQYKDDPSAAGLMVGLEFEPIVKKMLNKYRDLYGMDEYTLDLIANDVMIETRPGYNGIPALVRTWDPAKGASLTSHIYGNLPKRILGIIQNKYPDLGRTVELVQEKADKLTTDEGFGGSGMANDGFVDISSPEAYTRVSRKKAEVTMGMPPEYVKRAEEIGERILMSTKLQDLDAKIVGTIKDSEGRTLRVAMLESNKARVYLPDGTTEIIKARTPKVVEQKYGAADRSFKKIATTKAQMVEEAKAYLIPEMEKTAGGLKDNYEPTLQYTEFIDKTFSLYKDYLSQSAINKRFADFKEPVIDPKTGKQAREKTAQGKKIFTKKPLTLAEWRKYFIGDGTRRIDGRRRSLLEALATEQGFDKVMEVLGKEEMRKQIESRQKDLSTELIENYVAVIAKSLDRNNPNVMASKAIKSVSESTGKSVKWLENYIRVALDKAKGDVFKFIDILKEEVLPSGTSLFEEFRTYFNEDYRSRIKDAIATKGQLKSGLKTYLQQVLNAAYEVNRFADIENVNKKSLDKYKANVNEYTNYIVPEMRQMHYGENNKKGALVANALSRMFGFDGRRNKNIPSLENDGKGYNLSRKEFVKFSDKKGEEISGKYDEFYNSLPKNKQEDLKDLRKKLSEVNSLSIHYAEFNKKYLEIATKEGATKEEIDNFVNHKNHEAYIKEQALRTRVFKHMLDVMDYVGKQKLKRSEAEYDNYMENFVAPFFIEQSREGFRHFSTKEFYSLLPFKKENIKNQPDKTDQHVKAKVIVAAEFIDLFAKRKYNSENTLNEDVINKILLKYESVIGGRRNQERADIRLGSEYGKDWAAKIGAEQLLDMYGGDFDLDYLKLSKSILTGETLFDRFMKESFNSTVDGLIQDPKAKSHNNKIIESSKTEAFEITKPEALASKKINLAEETANMIERRTGISAKAPLSASRAANIGRTKGKFDFYLPPNAEDFAGLLYKLYGKGKQGDKDMAFMKEHLLDPYNAGEQAISTYKQNLAEDYKSIEKQLGEIEGTVSKETKATLDELGFNADQAVRVALWNQAGFEIPGIQNIEAAKLRIAVVKDKRLKAYADGIRTIVKGNLFEPSEQWFSSNIRYDLFTHATEGVRPKFLEQWDTNVKEIFNKENLIKLEAAYGKNYVKNLNDMITRMKTGKTRGANLGKEANAALDYLNGSIGVTMWMNTRSAVLQTISAVNYINWSDNNPIRIAQTLAKPKEFASTFMEIFNSDFLKQRRSGLEINIEEAEIARAVEKSKGKASRIFNALIKAGFTPTQIADSFAIAIGGTPLLMNRTKTYQRKGFEYAEAREKAFNDLREISEENQQSSRQDKVSNIQVGVMGRLVFAFNNTPFQMTRLQKKAALDLVNRRGDWKTNTSKLAYYSVLQSVVFYALQQGAALTLFGKDDEDLTKEEKENIAKYKEKKVIGLANSVVDGFLSGSGLPGKILVTGKNTLAKYLEEEKKGYKADYGDVLNEAFSISPPISSKTKKAYSAFNTFRYGSTKKGKAKYDQSNKLSPLHPMNVARAKMFSAVTNIPLDRVVTKIDNLNEAVTNTDIEPQIRLALALGWGKWSLGFYDGLYGEDAKDVEKSKKKSSSARKQKNRQKALDFSKKSFRYRDSVRLANYRKKNKK